MERWGEHLEELAREVLPESVHRYVRQGARDGVTTAEAVAAWERFRFLPGVLRDVTEVVRATECFVTSATREVMPVAAVRLESGEWHEFPPGGGPLKMDGTVAAAS